MITGDLVAFFYPIGANAGGGGACAYKFPGIISGDEVHFSDMTDPASRIDFRRAPLETLNRWRERNGLPLLSSLPRGRHDRDDT